MRARYYNTYDRLLVTMDELAKQDQKPKLLMHACCGPCASSCLVLLYDVFDITLYYTNSNIFPAEEYERRKEELVSFVDMFNKDYHADVKVICDTYDPQRFLTWASPLKDDPETGRRCQCCYEWRLDKTMAYASTHHYDYVATTLTLSRLKNSNVINAIGEKLNLNYPTITYLPSDFKKNKGLDLSVALTDHYHMYRQDYCGCPFSRRQSR